MREDKHESERFSEGVFRDQLSGAQEPVGQPAAFDARRRGVSRFRNNDRRLSWYEALRQIGEDVLRIHEHVKSIVTSAREQSVGLNEINTSISQMDQVTQTNAVDHRLGIDAANLMQLVMQFKTGEGMSARQTPREGPAASHSRQSPARSLIGKIAVAFNGGTAAKVIASPVGDNWEEF